MATQMQLEVVVAGIAWLPTSCEAEAAIKRVNKDENGKRKLFLYPCKDRDKDKVGDRPAKLNEKESGRELAREKKANDKFFCWKKNMKIL